MRSRTAPAAWGSSAATYFATALGMPIISGGGTGVGVAAGSGVGVGVAVAVALVVVAAVVLAFAVGAAFALVVAVGIAIGGVVVVAVGVKVDAVREGAGQIAKIPACCPRRRSPLSAGQAQA